MFLLRIVSEFHGLIFRVAYIAVDALYMFRVRACVSFMRNDLYMLSQVSRLLLLGGANPNAPTTFLNNAPMLAVMALQGYSDMVTLLLEYGASVGIHGDDGMTPLCFAAQKGHVEVIQTLVAHKSRVSLRRYRHCKV